MKENRIYFPTFTVLFKAIDLIHKGKKLVPSPYILVEEPDKPMKFIIARQDEVEAVSDEILLMSVYDIDCQVILFKDWKYSLPRPSTPFPALQELEEIYLLRKGAPKVFLLPNFVKTELFTANLSTIFGVDVFWKSVYFMNSIVLMALLSGIDDYPDFTDEIEVLWDRWVEPYIEPKTTPWEMITDLREGGYLDVIKGQMGKQMGKLPKVSKPEPSPA